MAGILDFASTGPTRKLDSYVVPPMPPKTHKENWLVISLSNTRINYIVVTKMGWEVNLLELGRDIPPIVFISHY